MFKLVDKEKEQKPGVDLSFYPPTLLGNTRTPFVKQQKTAPGALILIFMKPVS